MKRNIIIGAVALAAILAGGSFWYFGRLSQAAEPVPLPAAVPVVAATVTSKDVPIYLRGIGTVIAYNTVSYAARSRGRSPRSPSPKDRPSRRATCSHRLIRVPIRPQIDQPTANRDRDQAQLERAGQSVPLHAARRQGLRHPHLSIRRRRKWRSSRPR